MLVVVFLFLIFACSAFAIVPRIFHYQGKLTNTSGVGTNDTLSMTFRLYDAPWSTIVLWSETHTGENKVPVVNGLFDVLLGGINPINLPFNVQYWLEIEVGGCVLMPRVRLTTSPYAFRAAVAESLVGASPARVDTFVAHWDSIRGMPEGFRDGIDNVGSGGGGEWIVRGADMYSNLPGNVGIGTSTPNAKIHLVVDNCDTAIAYGYFLKNFEDGTLAPLSSDPPSWFVTNSTAFEGSRSAQSAPISHGGSTGMTLVYTNTRPGWISFAYRTSTELGGDVLTFFIDGVPKNNMSGERPWETLAYPLTIGTHTFLWRYTKNASGSSGSDCVWVDFIQIADTAMEITCNSISALYSNGSGTRPAAIFVNGNVGIGTTTPARPLHVTDVMRIQPRSSAPANPSEGDMYMDATTHKLMVYDGSSWRSCW